MRVNQEYDGRQPKQQIERICKGRGVEKNIDVQMVNELYDTSLGASVIVKKTRISRTSAIVQ